MPIQQRSQLKGFGQSTNEKYIVLDINDIVTELNEVSVKSVVAGSNVTVDNTDPANPIVSALGGGGIHALNLLSGFNCTYSLLAYSPSNMGLSPGNRIWIMPFLPAKSFSSQEISIKINSSTAGALGKILFYSSLNGLPNTLLFESTNLDLSTTGIKTLSYVFDWEAGETYFICFWNNMTGPTMDGVGGASMYNLGFSGSSTAIGGFTKDVTYGTTAPSPMGGVQVYSSTMPAVLLKVV